MCVYSAELCLTMAIQRALEGTLSGRPATGTPVGAWRFGAFSVELDRAHGVLVGELLQDALEDLALVGLLALQVVE